MKVGQITIQETAGRRVGRLIDVGETVRAGYPAAAAVLTYCIERKNLTQILYATALEELPSRYVLALILNSTSEALRQGWEGLPKTLHFF